MFEELEEVWDPATKARLSIRTDVEFHCISILLDGNILM
jgi:hypothetical protein